MYFRISLKMAMTTAAALLDDFAAAHDLDSLKEVSRSPRNEYKRLQEGGRPAASSVTHSRGKEEEFNIKESTLHLYE